ncbi:MAG: crossover junction endodeoxyribonuclease RuvC [Acidobacteriota bacterium]
MILVGIDPGSQYTGYGVVRRDGSKLTCVDHGRFSLPSKAPVPERLGRLSEHLSRLLDQTCPSAVAVESVFHGVNTRSLVVLAQARGAILAELGRRQLDCHEYSPSEVKRAVTGSGRAHKDQVARMVKLLLNLRGGKFSADATDALAVAVCLANSLRVERIRDAAART